MLFGDAITLLTAIVVRIAAAIAVVSRRSDHARPRCPLGSRSVRCLLPCEPGVRARVTKFVVRLTQIKAPSCATIQRKPRMSINLPKGCGHVDHFRADL